MNSNNLEKILSLCIDIFSLFINYDDFNFITKIIYLKIIIVIIINDGPPDIKESPRIKELSQTLADKIKNDERLDIIKESPPIKELLEKLANRIKNLQNSMTRSKDKNDFFLLYNGIKNYFNTYGHYLEDDNANNSSSSVSSSSRNKHRNNRGRNNRGPPSEEKKKWIRGIVKKKRDNSEIYRRDREDEYNQYIKEKIEKQKEFNATIVEK